MKKLYFTIAATMLLTTASSTIAQETTPELVGRDWRGSVGSTLREAMRTRCVSDPQYQNEIACDGIADHVEQTASDMAFAAETFCTNNGQVPINSIFGVIVNCLEAADTAIVNMFDGVPEYHSQGEPDPDIAEYFRQWCEDFYMRPTSKAGGGVHMPPLMLEPGGPIKHGPFLASDNGTFATSFEAAMLWRIHKQNMGRADGTNQPWYGVWRLNDQTSEYSQGFSMASRLYLNGSIWSYSNYYHSISGTYLGQSKLPCPTENAGGTFHFYYQASGDDCVWFAGTNPMSSYAYASEVFIPKASLLNWPNARTAQHLRGCRLSKELVSKIAQAYWEKAHQLDPTTPPPPTDPIGPDEVIHCGGAPNLRGIQEARDGTATSSYSDCPEEHVPPPDPDDPDPTDPGGGGDGAPDGWYDPPPPDGGSGLVFGDWDIEMPDWWPNLPNLDFASATCPTYQLDLNGFFGETFVLDSHCPLIEDFRAIIAAIMLVVWTGVAAVIVMKA